MKPIAFFTESPEARTSDALAAGWARVIATRDASPEGCPCRDVTGPLIAAWEAYAADTGARRPSWHIGQDYAPFTPEYEAQAQRREAGAPTQWANLAAAQAAQAAPTLLPAEGGDVVIDVRTEDEFKALPRWGARNVPLAQLEDLLDGKSDLDPIPREARVVVYCASGKRATLAVETLRAAGWHACNGHEQTCEIPGALGGDAAGPSRQTNSELRGELPALRGMLGKLDDPRMGGTGWSTWAEKAASLFGGSGGVSDGAGPQRSAEDRGVTAWPVSAPPVSVLALTPEDDPGTSAANRARTGTTADPPMGAAPGGDIFSGLDDLFKQGSAAVGGAAQGAGQQAGTAAGQAAGRALAEAAPAVGDAVRAQVPATVSAVGQAAGPAVSPLATQAGDAAGRAAVKGAKDEAKDEGLSTGAKVAIGGGIVLAAALSAWSLLRKKGSKK